MTVTVPPVTVPPVTIDASQIQVKALSDEQWNTIVVALSVLTFFVTAGFWTTMRRRGS